MKYQAETNKAETEFRFDGRKDKTVGIKDTGLHYAVLTGSKIDHKQKIEKIIPLCDELGIGYDITMIAMRTKESLKMLSDIETGLNTE